jgi:uncharacterized protein DUF6438
MPMNVAICVFPCFLALTPIVVHPTSSQSAFSDIKHVENVVIVLKRGGGMGWGPSYLLSISGDGSVTYKGYAGVFIKGKRTAHISKIAMNQLIEEFRNAHFFELQDAYQSAATDLPGCVTEFQTGTNRKKIVDYGLSSTDQDGLRSGAPQALLELEKRIDEIVGSKRWVQGSWLRRLLHWH